MATKPLVTTTVFYHGGTDPIVFEDAINNGVTGRDGSNVKAQLLRRDTVDGVDQNGDHYIIPYHAVILASVTSTAGEFTPAQDAFCVAGNEDSSEEPGNNEPGKD